MATGVTRGRSVLIALVLFALVGCQPAALTESASAQPTEPPSASPSAPTAPTAPTAEPRDMFAEFPVPGGDGVRISGLAEVRGTLYAFGSVERTGEVGSQPAIWASRDGELWVAANVPPMRDRQDCVPDSGFDDCSLAGGIWDLVGAGDRLIALAAGGLAEGSGAFTTTIYASVDGLTWVEVTETPGHEAGAHFSLALVDGRLIAGGHGVWSSDDGGATWRESTTVADLRGTIFDLAVSDGLLVAVGGAGTSDIIEPPAVAWVSADRGDSWDRREIGGSFASAVAVTEDNWLALGTDASGTTTWASTNGGESWTQTSIGDCCPSDLVATPTGFVVLVDDGGVLVARPDAAAWSPIDADFDFVTGTWTPQFGLVLATRTTVVLAPNPFP